jgi:branched-chain amino acid transport system substrate-binding protein
MRLSLLGPLLAGLLCAVTARADGPPVTLGVLTDLTSVHARVAGRGSVAAAEIAIAERGETVLGRPVRLVHFDHAGRADTALATARRWYDQDGVEAILDVPNAGIARAVNRLAGQRRKVAIFSTPMIDDLTETECNGHGLAWTWNAHALMRSLMASRTRAGVFLIASDHAGGRNLEAAARAAAQAFGVQVVGTAWHAYGATDFGAVIDSASKSGAASVVIATAGADLVNLLREARPRLEKQSLAVPYLFEVDINDLGQDLLKGVEFASAFAWNRDMATKEFAKRFSARTGEKPNMIHAGVYSATLSYLKAVEAVGNTDGWAVSSWMRRMRVDDAFARGGQVMRNGRFVHDMFVMRVKDPPSSRGPRDLAEVVSTVPGMLAYRPAGESTCPLLRAPSEDPLRETLVIAR